MSKIKLTKGELKRQRDSLKQFRQYLPTLQLKKQQLQMKVQEAEALHAQKQRALEEYGDKISKWAGLLADPRIEIIPDLQGKQEDIRTWIIPTGMDIKTQNIAGANVPHLSNVLFRDMDYDFFSTPLWIDHGIEELRKYVTALVEVAVVKKRIDILKRELRVTSQRVNLFEKVKIPECAENIRRIRIYLGDLMANAVGISKVAKKKIELLELATNY